MQAGGKTDERLKTEYQRRADLFYNLVQSVKSHKNFEKETLIEVIKARSGKFGDTKAQEMKSMNKMDSGMAGLLGKLNVVFEQYPNLKSSEQHNKLMDEIRITEDRVNIARTDYNDTVREYNNYVQMFPSNILASKFQFKGEIFFENEEESNKPVRIDLE
jgi:LemA protein